MPTHSHPPALLDACTGLNRCGGRLLAESWTLEPLPPARDPLQPGWTALSLTHPDAILNRHLLDCHPFWAVGQPGRRPFLPLFSPRRTAPPWGPAAWNRRWGRSFESGPAPQVRTFPLSRPAESNRSASTCPIVAQSVLYNRRTDCRFVTQVAVRSSGSLPPSEGRRFGLPFPSHFRCREGTFIQVARRYRMRFERG